MNLLLATIAATSPLTVRVDGSAVPAPAARLTSYTPAAGDRVLTAYVGTRLVVLGKIV